MELVSTEEPRAGVSRRGFLGRAGGVLAAAAVGVPATLHATTRRALAAGCSERGPLKGQARRDAAYDIRLKTADRARSQPLAAPSCDGDEDRYPLRTASFSKGLPHDRNGHVDPVAYTALLTAIETGRNELYDAIPLGGTRKLTNPHAAMTYGLEGFDSHDFVVPSPPAFDSAQRASEVVELYWMALTRDVPFAAYDTDPLVARAAADLSAMSDFRAPKIGVAVTPATLFRGHTPGDLVGPYVSQFLWKDVPFGPATISQRYRGGIEGLDFMTAFASWLSVQRGEEQAEGPRETTTRYIRNGRDLAEWVHRDFPFQAGIMAAQILLAMPGATDPGNPYVAAKTQDPFSTFGGPFVLDLVARVANAALRAAWYQKWALHRTLRPEAFGGRVHNHATGVAAYPIHDDLLLNSGVLAETRARHKTFLLPIAYAEGSPLHPAYPSGHATFVGACVTVLKALFNESAPITDPVVAGADGLALTPYTGPALTVGNELNKLAANVALGRCTAGVHYRSDAIQGLLLGEAVALRILADIRATLTEPAGAGLSLTRFNGATATF
ncbi:MAG TPA: vanadium-dependent haloperoxidase [Frankiaceae bacterium]|nr:vanadium-dependent haloperoxidase [Frankiaceae bacterium]